MLEQSWDSFLKLFARGVWACVCGGTLWDCHFKKLHVEAGDFPLKLMKKKKNTRIGSNRIKPDRLMKLKQWPNLHQARNVDASQIR